MALSLRAETGCRTGSQGSPRAGVPFRSHIGRRRAASQLYAPMHIHHQRAARSSRYSDFLTSLTGIAIQLNQGRNNNATPGDPFSLLQSQRIVFLGGEINDLTADAAINQLMLLDSDDSSKPIKMFINSPGGSVTAGMGIYDTMNLCGAPVETYCFGLAASMGAFLLGAGEPGRRYALPNARIMIHQPLGGFGGRAAEVEVQTNEIMFHKANLNRIMSSYTGQPINRIERDTDRDFYMSPREAVAYGIIDLVIGGEDAGVKISEGTRGPSGGGGARGVGLGGGKKDAAAKESQDPGSKAAVGVVPDDPLSEEKDAKTEPTGARDDGASPAEDSRKVPASDRTAGQGPLPGPNNEDELPKGVAVTDSAGPATQQWQDASGGKNITEDDGPDKGGKIAKDKGVDVTERANGRDKGEGTSSRGGNYCSS